jgi:isorenieratene synthase
MAADTLSAPSARPFLPERPTAAGKRVGLLDAVIRMQARCAPEDVIANRLDPWHGVYYHPHSFGRLRVIAQAADAITVRVAYRVAGPFAVEVDARFHCSDPRSIVMTIVAGEGIGSVVETHATPIRTGSCAIVELTLATSERVGFRVAAQSGGLFRPLMAWAARRLWVEDARYAERLYELRQTKLTHEADADTSKDVRDTNGGGAALRDTLSGG